MASATYRRYRRDSPAILRVRPLPARTTLNAASSVVAGVMTVIEQAKVRRYERPGVGRRSAPRARVERPATETNLSLKLRAEAGTRAYTRSGYTAVSAGQWRWRWDLNPRMSCPITRFRVLRGTVHRWFPPSAACSSAHLGDGGGQCRTEVNETKTETNQLPLTGPVAPIRRRTFVGTLLAQSGRRG